MDIDYKVILFKDDPRRKNERSDFRSFPERTMAPANLPREEMVVKMKNFDNRRFWQNNCAIRWEY